MTKVAIVYHSGKGHTKVQAEYVKKGAESVSGTEVLFLDVVEAEARLDDLDTMDAIIFGSPTYMGNVSAGMKAFQEAAVSRWFTQAWKNKIAGAFTVSTNLSGDKNNTLNSQMIFAMQLGMIYVGLGMLPATNEPDAFKHEDGPSAAALNRVDGSLGAMASAMALPPEQLPKGDCDTAFEYGKRIAEITAQFVKNNINAN